MNPPSSTGHCAYSAGSERKYTVLKSAPYFLEILDKRVNKGTGVKSLADVLGIKPEESWRLAIGKTTSQ